MTLQAHEACVPAFPLGHPSDRDRYGLTPELANLYRLIIDHVAEHERFPHLRWLGKRFGNYSGGRIHQMLAELVERGWLFNGHPRRKGGIAYSLVEPIIRFPHVPSGSELINQVSKRNAAARVRLAT